MSDPRNTLQKMFEPGNRFANFGEVIVSMQISGIRCHSNTTIDLNSPIVAFSGLNGTGKSTILQLVACAYRPPNATPYNIGKFIIANQLDPTSVSKGSSVKFAFWTADGTTRPLTLSYTSSWNGYSRRTTRSVLFAGIGHYLPRSESPSFMYRARTLKAHNSAAVAARIRDWTCKVLAQGYDEVTAHQTNITTRLGNTVSSVKRSGIGYSESNMGFGEARALNLIQILETIPERSLVLIEEPETSLHLSAQQEFGHYLVDVCIHRKHQILLTSHSEFILRALPATSCIYLDRRGASIEPVPGLTPMQARSLMAGGKVKALNILVEDETGMAILAAIVRRHEPGLLRTWGIHVGGDKDRIATTVRCIQAAGIALAAVRDGDVGDAPKENIFKLPGTMPPEKEIFQSPAFEKYMAETYGMVLADFRAGLVGKDHHGWFDLLASMIGVNRTALIWEAAKAYVSGVPETETAILVMLLKEASQQKKAP
jgi:predicted ATPase